MGASRRQEKYGIKHRNSLHYRRRVWVQREKTDKPIRNYSLKTKTLTERGEEEDGEDDKT
jgi:hypothetical protein